MTDTPIVSLVKNKQPRGQQVDDVHYDRIIEFRPFPKIARLFTTITVTEKLDGSNAAVVVTEDGEVLAQSRNRFITPGKLTDNYSFAQWVENNAAALVDLGPGVHFGEWWGEGIARRYSMSRKVFSLFNTERFGDNRPDCCDVVPVLFKGEFDHNAVIDAMAKLRAEGSAASPGFMNPEGVMVYHHAAQRYFKAPFDTLPKGLWNVVRWAINDEGQLAA